jgi:hypothetical protein
MRERERKREREKIYLLDVFRVGLHVQPLEQRNDFFLGKLERKRKDISPLLYLLSLSAYVSVSVSILPGPS